MEKKNVALLKNTGILAIGQFIPKIISVITLPLLTGVFSTSDYGIYDLVISFSSLFLPLLTFMIQQAVFRYLIENDDEKNRKKYISCSISFISILSTIFFLIIMLIGVSNRECLSIIFIAGFIYIFESFYDLFGQISRGIGNNVNYSLGTIIYSSINMILLLVSALTNIINLNVALIIIAMSYLLSSIFLGIRLQVSKYIDIRYVKISNIKELLKYSIPIIPGTISLWLVNLSDRLIISWYLGASQNGIYSAATKLPNLFATVFNVFNLAWTEVAARSINEKDVDKYYSVLFKNLYSFMIGILIVLITISPIMYNVLIDAKFHDGYNQLPVLYIGILSSCFVSFFGGLYVALKRTKEVGFSSIIGAVLNVLINIIFIEKIGLYAASFSTLISFMIILIYRIIDIKKFINITYDLKSILIGIIFVIIVIVGFYINNITSIIINAILAIVYNLKFNIFLLKFMNLFFNKIKGRKRNEI